MYKYQFIVFLQDEEATEAEAEAEKINSILPDENYYRCMIEYLSNWDYGNENTEIPITLDEVYDEIGSDSEVIENQVIYGYDHYLLAYNTSLPTYALYRRLRY